MNSYQMPIADLEIRDEAEGILLGRIVPYGETIDLWGQGERFRRGAFNGNSPKDVVLLAGHDSTAVIGRGKSIDDRPDGAWMEFKLASTDRANEEATLIREGMVRSLSVGFQPVKSQSIKEKGKTVVEHARVILREVSTTAFPAYKGAAIAAVRQETDERGTEVSEEQLEAINGSVTEVRTDLDGLMGRLEGLATQDEVTEIRSALAALVDAAPNPVEQRVDATAWFQAEARALQGDDTQKRALADVVGTFDGSGDASGLVPEIHIGSQLVHVLDFMRPVFSRAGSFPMPTSGYARIPVVSQKTVVGKRGTQKAEANSQALQVTPASYEAEWFDSGLDVSLEIVATADPEVLGIIWDDMASGYAQATEADICTKAVAAATHTGAALAVDTYANFMASVIPASRAVKAATGDFGRSLAVTEANWVAILGLSDSFDRRQFAAGSLQADGQAGVNAEAITLDGGVTVFPAGVTVDVMFNDKSLRAADGGLSRVQALNVPQMGVDVGVLGRTMVVPRIPAGILSFEVVA